MSWFAEIRSWFTGASNFKAVTDNLWMMIKELKEEAARDRAEVQKLRDQVHIVERAEEECQRRIIPLLRENNDLREELLFIKKEKK